MPTESGTLPRADHRVGRRQLETGSEAELFKKIPNIDELDRFRDLTDQYVVITLRGIGEMTGDKIVGRSAEPRARSTGSARRRRSTMGRPRALCGSRRDRRTTTREAIATSILGRRWTRRPTISR